MRGYQQEGVVRAIRDAGGELYGVTSESQALATEAGANWELEFQLIGDPHHEIADHCRDLGWLDLYVNTQGDPAGIITRAIDANHPKGYFQPGVLALTRDHRILYRWRSRPTRHNNGGATERPTPPHIWQRLQHALAQQGNSDAALDTPPKVDIRGIPWPLFVALLLANGNFWRPQAFALERGGRDSTTLRATLAAMKLLLFVVGWVAAFVLLPAAWVALALLASGAIVTPGIVAMHRAFQSAESAHRAST